MSKKIKWAVIGSGGIARRRTIPEGIVPAENAELVGERNPAGGSKRSDAKHSVVSRSYSFNFQSD